MTKRKKIIISSFLLGLGLIFIQTRVVTQRYLGIGGLSLLSYLLSAWSLRENLDGIEWLTVLMLPVLFTLGVGLFYFLLPLAWLARLPAILLYAVGVYILLLTANIFSVATIRNIQLIRAAQATGFLLTVLTAFFLFDTVLSFRLSPVLNFFIVYLISFLLFFQGMWSVTLEKRIKWNFIGLVSVLALVLAEAALAISFWPVTVASGSLFLISFLYIILGLVQNDLQERLFHKTVREYVWLGVVIFATIFLTTKWG